MSDDNELESVRRQVEQLRRDKEASDRAASELRLQKEASDRAASRLIRLGFPPLGDRVLCSSSSTASQDRKHTPLPFSDAVFRTIVDLQLNTASSVLWTQHDKHQLVWSSVQSRVGQALYDVIEAAGYSGRLDVLSEQTVDKDRPDFFLVRSNGVAVGVCEVKRPNAEYKRSALTDELLAGQIFDYMMRLRQTSGLRYVFGIVTTYFEWRVCWLRDTDECAASTTAAPSTSTSAETDLIADRRVHCSEIYQHDDPEVVLVLVSVLHKMCRSSVTPARRLYDVTRYYIKLGHESYDWEKLPASTSFSYVPPVNHTRYFYLLQEYHGGSDGRVHLACSGSGHLVVIKIGHGGENARPGLLYEAARWQGIWRVSAARVITLHKQPALLMPFVFHTIMRSGRPEFTFPNHWAKALHCGPNECLREITEDDALEQLVLNTDPVEAARQAVSTMVKFGYRHDDLEWRHVGLLPVLQTGQAPQLIPVLIDLHRVSELDPEQYDKKAKEKLIDDQLSQLIDALAANSDTE